MKAMLRRRRFAIGAAVVVVLAVCAPLALVAIEPDKDEADAPLKAEFTVEDLTWMSGHWHGQIFGGPITERWHKPAGGVMVGSSIMGSDRAHAMYEFLLIEEKDGAPTMFLRHFKQYLSSNEKAPMEFRLTAIEGKRATFETEDKNHTFSKIEYEMDGRELVVRLSGERQGKPMQVESRMKSRSKSGR